MMSNRLNNKVLATILTVCLLSVASPLTLADDHKKKDGPTCKFKQMDADGDGQVSQAEFMQASTKRFAKMDSNSDGFISKDEKKAYRSEHKKGECKHKK